jgi:sulfide:quinone oxidoreductase
MPSEDPFRSHPARVVVAGGGIAAVELLVALRKLAGARVRTELLTPGDHLVYRPLLVAEPFGTGSGHRFPLAEILADQGAALRRGSLSAVDFHAHEAISDSGERIPYDALAIATGARPRDVVPGALSFSGPAAVAPMRELVERSTRGEIGTLAFALARPAASWPLPLYELALMTASRARGTRIVILTAEHAPLELFGTAVCEAVRERLDRAGVALHTDSPVVRFGDGVLELEGDAEPLHADAVVTLPALEPPAIEGLPSGFLPIDAHGRVEATPDVYAAGDVTAYPVKQGGVSVRQAQAVAECLAARAGAPVSPEPFEPLLRGMLLTGAAPGYIESRAGQSLLADSPLWWPPTKVADSYLVPYLVARFQLSVSMTPGSTEGDLVSSAPAGGYVPGRPGRLAP